MSAVAFRVTFAPELAQYVAERAAGADRVRIVPSKWPPLTGDDTTRERAAELCAALNRVYAAPNDAEDDADLDVPAPGGTAWDEHDDENGAPY